MMPFKKNESKLQKNYEHACNEGYCPTTKEIENSAIRELANRLKAASKKETLTNILEWQDRNILFWPERWPVSILFRVTLVTLIFFPLFLPVFLFYSQILWLIIVMAILASSAVTTFLILIIILKYVRKIPLKQGLWNIFVTSIPMNSLLENKLGVCRDYAKLTACLLFNIYPDAEVYFVHAPQHVATGIMIENSPPVYMLDKQLPMVTISKWHERWHKHSWSEKTMEKVKKIVWNQLTLIPIYQKPNPQDQIPKS